MKFKHCTKLIFAKVNLKAKTYNVMWGNIKWITKEWPFGTTLLQWAGGVGERINKKLIIDNN